jgi:hypothetical protein
MGEVKPLRRPPMQVKFSHEFCDHHGKKITLNGNREQDATLKDIALDALMYPSDKEFGDLDGPEKVKRHDLGVKIMNFGDATEITIEEAALLKRIIGSRYTTVVVAQAYAILEGKEPPKYVSA